MQHRMAAGPDEVRGFLITSSRSNLRYGKGNTRLWTPPSSKPRSRYLTHEERDRLLEHVQAAHVRLFIILALTTGA